KVANALAEVFQANNIERSTQNSSKASDLLAREIASLQGKITFDTEALFNYARTKGLRPTLDPTLDVQGQRLQDLSKQLLAAEDKRKNAQAIYQSAKASTDTNTIPEVQKSERIADMQRRLSELKERKAALKVSYTDEWPEVKKTQAAIERLEGELAKSSQDAIGMLKADYEAALAHENSLRQMYNEQRGVTDQQTRDQIEMAAYTQRLETNKQYLN